MATSNFQFIPPQYGTLAETLTKAERYVYTEASVSALFCRKGLEELVRWMFEHDVDLTLPYDMSLNSLMTTKEFTDIIAPSFFQPLHAIRKLGNDAVHTTKKITPIEALHSLKLMHSFSQWVINIYSETRQPTVAFNESLVPKESEADINRKQLELILANYHAQQEELHKANELLEELKANKEANQSHIPAPIDPDEDLTRKIYIDTLLAEAGWDVTVKNVIEYPVKNCMPNANGTFGDGKVDYVLWGDNGKPLALVEAKRSRRDANVGRHQAKCYADCLEKEFGHRPIIFYTNGYQTYLWDDTNYPPRVVYGFYTKDSLQTLINRRMYKKNLVEQSINDDITNRPYQYLAIKSVADAFEKKNRSALLVMATGTGKTRVSASLVDLLSKANWVKRVLFLADRKALISQAKKNFNVYLPNSPAVNLVLEKEDESSRIVFSTYQTIINMIDGEMDDQKRYYTIGHFDLIIFDEIHRSVYNKYRHIFNYFDGYRIGLTATPKTETDKDTYELFGMQVGNPTYAYELDEAVNDKWLVPPKASSIPLKFPRAGIVYADLNEQEKIDYEEKFGDPITGAYPDEIDAEALNKWLFNTDTVDKVIAYLMENGIKVESGDKLAKTIIFARSHNHAEFIKKRFDHQYPHFNGHFATVIDTYAERAENLLDDFKVAAKFPQIAISVDMLDTGIDVPEVCNLVFFKRVRSSIKYWQMIGRGTRLCENLFGIGDNKTEFAIFDFCENFEFFGLNPKGYQSSSAKSISQRLFELRLRLCQILEKDENTDLVAYSKELKNRLINQTKELEDTSFIVKQHLQIVEKYQVESQWNNLSDLDIRDIIKEIAPIISENDPDEKAKNFDATMYLLQISTLTGEGNASNLINNILDTARKLSKKTSIPAVAAKYGILENIQKEAYWKEIPVLGIEKIRKDLRDIIKFIDVNTKPIYFTSYEDEFTANVKEIDLIVGYNDLEAYKRKVQQYLIEHKNHLTISKLRNNVPITKDELNELERMLFEQGTLGTKKDFEKAFGEQPLGKFVRSILGLEINAAKQAFGELLINTNMNANQTRFLEILIKFLSVKGTIAPGMLYESPFTDINPSGITGIFDQNMSLKIVALLDEVNHNAEVA
jgi:type I restriction enzyme, R subunit